MTRVGPHFRTPDEMDPPPAPPERESSLMEPGRKRWILMGVLAIVSAVIVAGAFVPAPHSGGDNAGYLALAYSLVHNGSYTEVFDPEEMPHTKYPPVFPILLAMGMWVGFRTWSAFKLVAAVSTVATVLLTYLWAERRLGAVWAAAVGLLVACSTSVVYYSHWVLSDMTFVALTLLSLWALDRSGVVGAGRRWLALGVLAAALAYFTRSAGLPLVAAVGAWLILSGHWRSLLGVAALAGAPMFLWLLRAQGATHGQYVSEFWLVNPYEPGLGRVGPLGLAGRVVDNLGGYIGTFIPSGIVGGEGPALTVLGIVLVAAAAYGWWLSLRRELRPAELFVPLYIGLILIWPAVWSGDRFVLPIYPILFVYAAVAIRRGPLARKAAVVSAVGAVAFLVMMLPALGAWTRSMREASACSAAVRQGGAFACYGPGIQTFVGAAGWAGANLPDGAAVLSRKPRMFYLMSGVPSRTFPFSPDPDRQLETADRVLARYVLIDQWDGLAGRYVVGAVQRRPGAFCGVQGFGDDGGTQLLGILPDGQRDQGGTAEDGGVRIYDCPASYRRDQPGPTYPSSSTRIPLLERLDR